MKIGSLYQTKNYYWMLYPSKDTAIGTGAEVAATAAAAAAAYWSRELGCSVSYISPNSLFMLLEQTERFCKVLSTEGMVGWIYLTLWCKKDIEEVKSL
jgi:hypothetical protein